MTSRLIPNLRARAPILHVLLVACALLSSMGVSRVVAKPNDISGHWEGLIEGSEFSVVMKLEMRANQGTWTGQLRVPYWGDEEWQVTNLKVDAGHIHFELDERNFDCELKDQRIEGVLKAKGQRYKFWLGRERIEQADHPRRPQIPKAPFPYWVEDVEILVGSQKISGLLTVPDGKGPYPAVVLLCGGGAFDRDYNWYNHCTFMVLADHLARAGIASLRIDSRGVGTSSGNFSDSTLDDLANDARQCVTYLLSREEIRGDAIGLVGHSFGTDVALRTANISPNVAFCVLLAPSAGRWDIQSVRGIADMQMACGLPRIRILVDVLDSAIFVWGSETDMSVDASMEIDRIARAPFVFAASLFGVHVPSFPKSTAQQYFGRIEREMLRADPAADFRRTKVPILAISGNLDLQIRADETLRELRRLAAVGGNSDVTLKLENGLNHCLQTAVTGLPDEGKFLDETLAPRVMESISGWILDRSKK